MRVPLRVVLGALGAPLVAATPFLLLVPVVNYRVLVACYVAAFVLGFIALVILDAAHWLVLRSFVTAGIAVSLLILPLLPMLQALASGGWQPPQLFPSATTLFVLLLAFAGAAAGAFWWWMVDPQLWPTTDEMIDHVDD